MATTFFIFAIIATFVCYHVWAWAHARLFTFLGYDDNGSVLVGYHALTIPARIVAFAIGCMAIFICCEVWFAFMFMFM